MRAYRLLLIRLEFDSCSWCIHEIVLFYLDLNYRITKGDLSILYCLCQEQVLQASKTFFFETVTCGLHTLTILELYQTYFNSYPNFLI